MRTSKQVEQPLSGAEVDGVRRIESLRPVEETLAALHDAGFDDHDALRAANALTALIFGTIQLQPARDDTSEHNQHDQQWHQHAIPSDALPHLHRAVNTPHPTTPGADFHYQLDLLITGLEHTAAPLRPEASGRLSRPVRP